MISVPVIAIPARQTDAHADYQRWLDEMCECGAIRRLHGRNDGRCEPHGCAGFVLRGERMPRTEGIAPVESAKVIAAVNTASDFFWRETKTMVLMAIGVFLTVCGSLAAAWWL